MWMGWGEDDCCLCFPLGCGVKTLFFLVAVGLTIVTVNIIGMLAHEQWYVLLQLLIILPFLYILFWVFKYGQKDCYHCRYKISEGFKYQFIISSIINLILFIIVLTVLEEFFDEDETVNQINQAYPGNYAYYADGTRRYAAPGSYPADAYGAPGNYYYGNDPAYRNYMNEQYKLNSEKVSDETIAWYAVLYGAFILIYGLMGFYWWTVVRRWAECYLNNVKTLEDMSSAKSKGEDIMAGSMRGSPSGRKSNGM